MKLNFDNLTLKIYKAYGFTISKWDTPINRLYKHNYWMSDPEHRGNIAYCKLIKSIIT